MKQESVPPFLGIVGDKKWSPFLDLGIRSPIFLAPKITENGRFRVSPLTSSLKQLLYKYDGHHGRHGHHTSGHTSQRGQTSQRGHTGQRDLTFKLEFPGNLCLQGSFRNSCDISSRSSLYSHHHNLLEMIKFCLKHDC